MSHDARKCSYSVCELRYSNLPTYPHSLTYFPCLRARNKTYEFTKRVDPEEIVHHEPALDLHSLPYRF